MKIRLILSVLTFCLLAGPAWSQGTVERAQKRTEQKANNRVDRGIDQEVDKVFDAIGGLFGKKKKADPEPAAAEPAEMSDEGPVFQNTQPFSLTMNLTEQKRNKSEEMSMRLAATTDKFAMLTDDKNEGSARMIYDSRDGKTTMITTDKKGEVQAYRMKIPKLGKLFDDAADETMDHLKIQRTDERRTIDGYDCELVIVENTKDNTTTRSWITHDLDLNSRDVFGNISRMMGGSPAGKKMYVPTGFQDLADGFPIQSTTVDGNVTYEMHFTDIKSGAATDLSLFDTSGVEIVEMGF